MRQMITPQGSRSMIPRYSGLSDPIDGNAGPLTRPPTQRNFLNGEGITNSMTASASSKILTDKRNIFVWLRGVHPRCPHQLLRDESVLGLERRCH